MATILVLGNSSAGLYDFRNELLAALLSAGHRVVVSLPDEVKAAQLADEGCIVEMTPIDRRGVDPVKDLKLLAAYRRLLQKYAPDVVLTYTIKPNVYGGLACRRAHVPQLATVTGLGSTFEREGMLHRLVRLLYRTGLKGAACVFFQNEENMGRFRSEGILAPGARTRLVSGSGVNLEKYPLLPYPEGEDTVFLYVGRMMREKGIGELLEAAGALAGEHVRFELLGYCDEDLTAELDDAEKRGYIRQLGFHTEVGEYYRRASAVVLPSYHEGMSNVLMEASASGRPVIATLVSGCREIFDEGISGFGCVPRSGRALTEALRKFLSLSRSERAAMGMSARAKMERGFDRRRITADYMDEIARHIGAGEQATN